MNALTVVFVAALFSLLVAFFYGFRVYRLRLPREAVETKKLTEIAEAISEGAMAFLSREYKVIGLFLMLMAVLIFFLLDNKVTTDFHEGIYTAISFITGAVISSLSGFIGMRIATIGNVRTAYVAKSSFSRAFEVAFQSGAVMGFGLVGLAILGMAILYSVIRVLGHTVEVHILMECLAGYGLGGSAVALFGRVGGGIYTKAADVGADLVGKVEKGIPEDDPRNPAVIADNVGDNVGDIAGMGSDLFGSVAEATSAALVIGATAALLAQNENFLLYPLLISAFGVPIAFITTLFARLKENGNVERALKLQLWISTVLMALLMGWVTNEYLPDTFVLGGKSISRWYVYTAFLTGLFSGLLIGLVTEYYTSHSYTPTREVAGAAQTGAATNIIYGLALGYQSALVPVLLLIITMAISNLLAGMFGIAIAALGMLSTIAIGLTIDAYGPVSDNAGGIAEMAELGKEVRHRTDKLDAAGNTTAAVGKGFAIGSAALTALALFSAFIVRSEVSSGRSFSLNILDPYVFGGLMWGALLPFLFSALTMKSVGKAALDMVEEVRRQFREIPGLMEKKNRPDYKRCVDISTKAALREMVLPGLLVLLTPLLVGYFFGTETLAGVLSGSLVSGVVLAVAKANAGGAWDNAKKFIEATAGGKGSEHHKAAVVGDTVGDPFKDTAGPSLNILIKLMAITSLVFADFFVHYGGLLRRLLS
ncbi:MAG: V-type H(+)-translocating pyrophosphatase [Leptospiraceae bacterium]|nr:V-type H(+)-translocating pyrophosphatase [Leptospiraceae bacterium]